VAGEGRPPEQLIRDWLEEHGSVTVGIEAIEQTWDLERLGSRDRRRIAQALEEAGVVVEPPLERASRQDDLVLSLVDVRPQTPDVRPQVREPQAAPVPEDSARPRVARLGLAATALGLMVVGSLGPWAKDVFVTDYGLDRDGAFVIAAAAVAALVLALHARRGEPSRLPIVAAALGALAIGVLAADFREVVDDTFVEPAWGLYVAAAGSALLVALSMSLLARRG
jgi:hypothetical protein